MKKLLSMIFVLSMCVTLTTFSVTTASAETVETQDVPDTIATQELDESIEEVANEEPTTNAELPDEAPEDLEPDITLDEYNEMLETVQKYKMKQKGFRGIANDYSVSYEVLNDKYIFVEIADKEVDYNAPMVVQRNSDIVWLQNLNATEFVVYGDKMLYTAGELYEQGELTFEEFKKAGGAYFCDINDNDVVDVSDVTQLQLFLAGLSADKADILDVFFDVNFDEYIDVSDATKVQMYIAGYEDIPCYGHNVVTKDYREATCIAKGYTGDSYCEDCQKLVRAGTEIVENKANHMSTEIRNVKEPTTEAEGYTGDVCCMDCGAVISKGEPIEKLPSPEDEIREIEHMILEQINEEREANGLAPVEWDEELLTSVETRAQEFSDRCHGYYTSGNSHIRPNGEEWHSILTERYSLCGEILAASNIKEDLVALWMNSEVHRGVILTEEYTYAGIGIVKIKEDNGIEMYYACAIFRADKLKRLS